MPRAGPDPPPKTVRNAGPAGDLERRGSRGVRAALERCATRGQWLPTLSPVFLICELERLRGRRLGIAGGGCGSQWEGPGTWPEAALTRCLFRCLGESKGRAGARVPAPKRLGCTYPASGAHRSTRPQHTETRVTPAARAPASPSSNFRRGETEAGRGEATAKVTARGWRSRQAGRARAPDPGCGLRLRSVPALPPRAWPASETPQARQLQADPRGRRWAGGALARRRLVRCAAGEGCGPGSPPPRACSSAPEAAAAPTRGRLSGTSEGEGDRGRLCRAGPGGGYEAAVVGTTQVARGCRAGDWRPPGSGTWGSGLRRPGRADAGVSELGLCECRSAARLQEIQPPLCETLRTPKAQS